MRRRGSQCQIDRVLDRYGTAPSCSSLVLDRHYRDMKELWPVRGILDNDDRDEIFPLKAQRHVQLWPERWFLLMDPFFDFFFPRSRMWKRPSARLARTG